MKPTHFLPPLFNCRRFGRKLLVVFLCLGIAHGVFGQVYTVPTRISYNIPGGPLPPQFDDTAFVNPTLFSITYNQLENNQIEYSEPWVGTLYFTNTGVMTVNSAAGGGYGFEFDTLEGNSNVMAGTFDNPSTIHANSELDGNFGVGACIISATNVLIQSGKIEVGPDGLIQITGQNVDLTGSQLTLETGQNVGTTEGPAPFTGTDSSGLTTNSWNPFVELTANSATSANSPPLLPFGFSLFFSTAYNLQTGTNLNRSAFVENLSNTNVTYNVFFGPPAADNGVLGSGEVAIGWVGTFLNYATGQLVTNYLYLNDDYIGGSVTNVPPSAAGYPQNFTLTVSTSSLTGSNAPAVPSLTVFPNVGISNAPYVFGTFTSDSMSLTNASVDNPGGSVTNLATRIDINASRELNMNFATISGPNYMSIIATNQFDGSAGGQISSLYSDLNLGVTNGNLTVSNLVASQIPEWSGEIEAWSVRFFTETSNSIVVTNVTSTSTNVSTNTITITNDWRSVLVESDLSPDSIPQIDNLTLHVTNNLVISDALNVFGSFLVTPQSLTLTTNAEGTGASSAEGEINLENPNSPTWTWSSSFPNLLYLTNNGAISTPNFANIIGSTQAVMITTSTPAVSATATLSESGTNVITNSTVTIAGIVYTFTNTVGKPTSAYAVKMGPTFDATMTNLIAAINFGAGGGVVYSTNSPSYTNVFVSAGLLSAGSFTVSAIVGGISGDSIPVSSSPGANVTWNSSLLSGGINTIPGSTNTVSVTVPYGAIINNGVISDEGTTISANNFVNGGTFANDVGSFTLDAINATLTNGSITAGGDISLSANTLIVSNVALVAGRSLTLDITNSLTDFGVSNANTWVVGDPNGTGFDGLGLILPILPSSNTPGFNNLLGTAIYMASPALPSATVSSVWAGNDNGASKVGYTLNNVAIGQLFLDSMGPNSKFSFTGTGVDNAMYVGQLVLNDYASYSNRSGTNIPTLLINTNMTIYYADAIASTAVGSGQFIDVSSNLNQFNSGRLRWISTFSGIYTFTNVTVPPLFVSSVTPPPVPAITSTLAKGGNFLLTISGSSSPVIIQASTNLQSWVNIATNTPPFTFTDSILPGVPDRFYRASQTQQ